MARASLARSRAAGHLATRTIGEIIQLCVRLCTEAYPPGNTIGFGAVGVVTYTGTVNGKSMSGSYTNHADGQKGSWSATGS